MNILLSPQFALVLAVGLIIGYGVRVLIAKRRHAALENTLADKKKEAQVGAEKILLEARQKVVELLEEAKKEERQREDQLLKHEERLDKKEADLEETAKTVKANEALLIKRETELKDAQEDVLAQKAKWTAVLEKAAGLSKEEAKDQIFKHLEDEYRQELYQRQQKLEAEGQESLNDKAKNLMALAMQRLASQYTSEITTYHFALPSDDIKGRVIGKEGRNIRVFERETGVDVIIDDTPGVLTLSSFNPIRREVARIALQKLINDGRIQPALIEKLVVEAKQEVAQEIRKAGEDAVYQLGIVGFHPDLIKIIGRLKYRTSYGQNVLEHSIEAARLAEMIANEVGGDIAITKKAALVHDIGKAVDHEVEGTHIEIGRRILQKFKVDEAVIKAMQSHHGDYPHESVEAVIVEVADAISGARPGARRSSIEEYLKRLGELENIANSFEGVEKTFAVQAGREIRVFVQPEAIDDAQAKQLAKGIAEEIESKMSYPGEIKVHVIRETRVVEYAR